jgi:hypothetical protein
MFASSKYTRVAASDNDASYESSSPSMTPCPSPTPTPPVRSPAVLLRRRRSSRREGINVVATPPGAGGLLPAAGGDEGGLPPVYFSSLSASILQENRRRAAEAAAVAVDHPRPVLVSALSASLLQDKRARAALERTVRERISGRQRHPAAIQRPGVEDRDPATMMEPLVRITANPDTQKEEERLPLNNIGGGGDAQTAATPLRVWSLVRGDPEARRRLAQRLEAMSRVTEVKKEAKEVVEDGSLMQGIRGFFNKIFTNI